MEETQRPPVRRDETPPAKRPLFQPPRRDRRMEKTRRIEH